ncbi:MAG: transporter [Gemmatimonadota bacterium]|nr:transporter [Gemmatimonadota bacterium]
MKNATPHTGLLALAAALLVPFAGRAQDTDSIATDRPDQTTSAASVPAGFLQVELGWTFARESTDFETVDEHALPGILLRVGLGAGLEARLGFGGYILREVGTPLDEGGEISLDGAGDASLGAKLEVAGWETGQLALLGGITLPVGDEAFSSERADPSFWILADQGLGDRLSLGANLGLAWTTAPDVAVLPAGLDPSASRVPVANRSRRLGRTEALDTQLEAPYTLALYIGVSDRVGAFVESFGAFGLGDDRDSAHGLDAGLTLLLSSRLQLDASGGVGLNEAAEDWFIGSGISFRLPR